MNNEEILTLDDYREMLQETNIKLVETKEKYETIKRKGNIINKWVIGLIIACGLTHMIGLTIGNPFVVLGALTTVLLVTPLGFYNTSLDAKEHQYEKDIEELNTKIDEYANKIEEFYTNTRQASKQAETIRVQTISHFSQRNKLNNIKR